eukprot:scaffold3332_cov130-Isochrysis_galbana.AAC.3
MAARPACLSPASRPSAREADQQLRVDLEACCWSDPGPAGCEQLELFRGQSAGRSHVEPKHPSSLLARSAWKARMAEPPYADWSGAQRRLSGVRTVRPRAEPAERSLFM